MRRYLLIMLALMLVFLTACSVKNTMSDHSEELIQVPSDEEEEPMEEEDEQEIFLPGEFDDPEPTPEIVESANYLTEGIYNIRVYGGTKVVNLSAKTDEGADKNKTNIMIWDRVENSNMQTFRLHDAGEGSCMIAPLASDEGNGRVLDVFTESTAAVGDNIDLWEKDPARHQRFWVKELEAGKYAILLFGDPALCMTCEEIDKNNANIYLDVFDGREEQLFAFVPMEILPKSDAEEEPEDLWIDKILEKANGVLGKKYAKLGEADEVFVEPDWGIMFRYGGRYVLLEESSAMSEWYGEYFETGNVPADVVYAVMTGEEKCVSVHFTLNEAGLRGTVKPEKEIVGEKIYHEYYGSDCYDFEYGGRTFMILCNEDGTISGDSYCVVYR